MPADPTDAAAAAYGELRRSCLQSPGDQRREAAAAAARARVVRACGPLVHRVAGWFAVDDPDVSYSELSAAGRSGVAAAADRYSGAAGSFALYALPHVQREMGRAARRTAPAALDVG